MATETIFLIEILKKNTTIYRNRRKSLKECFLILQKVYKHFKVESM